MKKTISLLTTDPKALLDLIEKGECSFEFPERLFDDDFPGHYYRKIKTIAISIPAIVGPYQNIKATLTQLGNQVIIKPDPNAVNFLLGATDAVMPGPDAMRSNWLINQQIALSRGSNDSGVFELNFNDDRYLPFEGTGAVSSWRLSMPKQTNRIRFESISDVIIHIRYTAIDGGSKFRREVTGLSSMKDYFGSRFFAMANMFPRQWFGFLNNLTDPAQLTFTLQNLSPAHINDPKLTGFYFKLDVAEEVDLQWNKKYVQLVLPAAASAVIDFMPDSNGGFLHTFDTPPLLQLAEGDYSINFLLKQAPADLIKDGFLNGKLVKDIKLILFYKGETEWD
ncbi:MAG: hypothetical protein WDO16_02110 [Bacteroidota bacterium]